MDIEDVISVLRERARTGAPARESGSSANQTPSATLRKNGTFALITPRAETMERVV